MKIRAACQDWMIFHTMSFSSFCSRNGQEAVHVEGKDFGDKKSVVCVFRREMGEVKPFDSSVKGLRKNSPEL